MTSYTLCTCYPLYHYTSRMACIDNRKKRLVEQQYLLHMSW